jgi:alpha-beta hydrolase superfamily lysophospholipase
MIQQEGNWKSPDGVSIYWQEWKPETDLPCGVVLLVHGLGEHCGRYHHVAEAFTQSGYALVAFDHRGHGRSEGVRGDDNMDLTCADITHFLEDIGHNYSQQPVFLYGHSLGGLQVLYYVLKHKPQISGVISTAPALAAEKGVSPVTILMAKVMSRLMPTMQIDNGLDRSNLSRNSDVIERYNNDPLVHGKITARFGMQLMQTSKWTRDHSEFPIPLLLMVGSGDHIIDPKAVQDFGENCAGDVTFQLLNGWYHEVHNEPEKKQILREMIQWMDNIVASHRH